MAIKKFDESSSGENITKWALKVLNENEMNKNKLKAITTDGANNMKGKWDGLNGSLQKIYNNNLYYNDCFCHRLIWYLQNGKK